MAPFSICVSILLLVGDSNRAGVTARYVSEQLGLSLSTAYRWIDMLRQSGLVVRHPNTRKLHLGPVAFDLGVQAVARPYVPPAIEEVLKPIASRHACRLHLVRCSGDYSVLQRTYFDRAELEIVPSKVAAMRLLGIGPAGVCLLSRWPDYEIDRYLVRNQDGLLAAGYQGADIRERVRQCRKLGCFVTRSVLTPGYTAVVIDFEVDGVVYGVSAASAGSEGGKQSRHTRSPGSGAGVVGDPGDSGVRVARIKTGRDGWRARTRLSWPFSMTRCSRRAPVRARSHRAAGRTRWRQRAPRGASAAPAAGPSARRRTRLAACPGGRRCVRVRTWVLLGVAARRMLPMLEALGSSGRA